MSEGVGREGVAWRGAAPAGPHARPHERSHETSHETSQVQPPGSPWLVGLPPVIGRATRLVVLGSFPGAASLQARQYYAHPRNHFWPILAGLWQVDLLALPYAQRLAEVRRHGLGLWDIYASCRRVGSLDSAIEQPRLNDLATLRRSAPHLTGVAHNGAESARARALTLALGVAVTRLPSTSPANASWSFECKLSAWRAVFEAHEVL